MSADSTVTSVVPPLCGESSPSHPAGACNLPDGHPGDHYALLPTVEGWVRWPHDWYDQQGPGKDGVPRPAPGGGQ